MNVISLKDYAAQKNISYEAVRQQVVRYKDELGGHVIRDGRQQFLDEDAVAFLDAKRQKNPVAIIQQNKDEQIEDLEEQVKQLLIKTAAQADQIAQLAQWKADNALAIAEAGQKQLLLESTKAELEQAKENEQQAIQAAAEARQAAVRARQERDAAEDGKKAVEDENHLLRQQMEQMKNRSRWDRFKDIFR